VRCIEAIEVNRRYLGVGVGVALSEGAGDAVAPVPVGDGLVGTVARGKCSVLKSALLMTKVSSRSSTRANQFPSPAALPTDNLWELLSSGEVVKVIVS